MGPCSADPVTEHHLAQINVGRLVAPVGSPEIAEFVALLDPVNALADASPGFVWRFTSPGRNDATAEQPREGLFVNLSVWESPAALWDFVYRTRHLDVVRRRREWFEPHPGPYSVMWWIPAGHIPSVTEAVERLELAERAGSSPRAFTFREPYDPYGAPAAPVSTSATA